MESPLLGIPAELRNNIYEEVFQSIDTVNIIQSGAIPQPALLVVCRQIREEGMLLFKDIVNIDSGTITFIESLSEGHIKAINKKQSLRIKTALDLPALDPAGGILRWLQFCAGTLSVCDLRTPRLPGASDRYSVDARAIGQDVLARMGFRLRGWVEGSGEFSDRERKEWLKIEEACLAEEGEILRPAFTASLDDLRKTRALSSA